MTADIFRIDDPNSLQTFSILSSVAEVLCAM